MDKMIHQKYCEFLKARIKSELYANHIIKWLDWIEKNNLKLDNPSSENITQFLLSVSNFSSGTRNNILKACRNFYGEYLGIKREDNKFYAIRLFKTDSRLPQYLTEEELDKAIKEINKTFSPLKVEAILKCLLFSGCRKMEFLNLHKKDFDLKNNSVKVFGRKTKKERTVFFPERISRLIENYFQSEPEEETNAFNITSSQLIYLVKKVRYFSGKPISIHSLRHSCGRLLIKSLPIVAVKSLLGHSNLQSTLVYTQLNDDEIKKLYEERVK